MVKTMMKTGRLLFIALFLSLACGASTADDWKQVTEKADFLHRSVKEVTDVIVHDIYSPPVASRIYAYVTVAGYEAARFSDNHYLSFAGQLHGLAVFAPPAGDKKYSYSLASVHAILTVARSLIISEDKIQEFQAGILQEFKTSGMPAEVYDSSLALGKRVADQVIAWAAKDNYKESRSLAKYAVGKDAASWKPTPPSFMKAIEPHWDAMRTFVIDSAKQFRPQAVTDFSTDKESRFFKEAKDVYEAGLALTPEQAEIANFWDCNPFKMNINGHVMYATKKISPGGHWVNITRLVCQRAGADLVRSAEAYASVCVILADAFISCWDEKYRSKVIRPETYINQYIDQNWVPLLQTPPFPEYTSGHSVISAASAVILTKLFGDHFEYTDSTENEFQLSPRHFKSFREASQEAAISRFYGGIHYIPSIVNGVDEGTKLGAYVMGRLKTRREDK